MSIRNRQPGDTPNVAMNFIDEDRSLGISAVQSVFTVLSNPHTLRKLAFVTPKARLALSEQLINVIRLLDQHERDQWTLTLRADIATASVDALNKVPLLDWLCTLFYAAVTATVDATACTDDPDAVSTAVRRLIELGPSEVPNEQAFLNTLCYALNWFWSNLDRPADLLRDAMTIAIFRWSAADDPSVNILAALGDFFNFSVFRFEPSPTCQCRLAMPAMTALSHAMQRSSQVATTWLPSLPPKGAIIHVGYLAMGADTTDQLTVALRHVAPALLAPPRRFRLTVFAWGNVSPDFMESLRDSGAVCHDVSWRTQSSVSSQIETILSIARQDPLAVLISDLNYSVPTAIFAARVAPVQIFLQGGMAAWPVPNLDAVFNSWGSDPTVAGWGDARILEFATPWDLASLNPPEQPEEIAAERQELPQGLRLIGTYGRLMKATDPFLHAVEKILQVCPDVAFVIGGSGGSDAIRAFIAHSPLGERMHLVDRYVPGHTWGRFLDLFLDTWPLTGGESVRETLAKGCPVVAIHSDEMPALSLQRDQALLAQDWDSFIAHAVRLLHDSKALSEAKQRAAEFAFFMSDPTPFRTYLRGSIDALLEDCRPRLLKNETAEFMRTYSLLMEPNGAKIEASISTDVALANFGEQMDALTREVEDLSRQLDRTRGSLNIDVAAASLGGQVDALTREMEDLSRQLDRTRGSLRTFLPHYLPRLRRHLLRRWITPEYKL